MAKAVKCPVCGGRVELEEYVEVGETVDCGECYSALKVVSLNPLRVEESLGINEDEDFVEYEEEDE